MYSHFGASSLRFNKTVCKDVMLPIIKVFFFSPEEVRTPLHGGGTLVSLQPKQNLWMYLPFVEMGSCYGASLGHSLLSPQRTE